MPAKAGSDSVRPWHTRRRGTAFARTFARELPHGIRTVGDSARRLATRAPARFLHQDESLRPALVDATVLALVREHLGPADVERADDFYIDLDAG